MTRIINIMLFVFVSNKTQHPYNARTVFKEKAVADASVRLGI